MAKETSLRKGCRHALYNVSDNEEQQGSETDCSINVEEVVVGSDDTESDSNVVISSWDESDSEESPTTSRVQKWLFAKPTRENPSTSYKTNDQLPTLDDARVKLTSTLVIPPISVNSAQFLVPYPSTGSSTESEYEKTSIKKKKVTHERKRNCKDWKVNIIARLHQSGKEYTNNKGVKIPAKSIKHKKNCNNCKFKCNTKVSQEEREGLFRSYYALPSHAEKMQYILKTTEIHTPCRSTVGPKSISRKKKSFKYNFFIENEKYQVCKTFYLDTLSISQKTVYNAYNSKNSLTGTPKEDNRGKMTKDKIKKSDKDYVRQHIASSLKAESHYCRAKTNKVYLDPLLNVTKMYDLYAESCVINQMKPVKLSMYRKIFNEEFNLEFLTPNSDLCDLCEEYKMSKTENLLTKELEGHINLKD